MFYQLLVLLIHLKLQNVQALVTYQSTLRINHPINETFSGLQLVEESIKNHTKFEDGITICLRFNFRKLGAIVFKHFSRASNPIMMEAQAIYKQTFLFFGNMNWIVKDMKSNSFIIWSTNRWHSICVSFDKKTSHIVFVKVSKCFISLLDL